MNLTAQPKWQEFKSLDLRDEKNRVTMFKSKSWPNLAVFAFSRPFFYANSLVTPQANNVNKTKEQQSLPRFFPERSNDSLRVPWFPSM